MEPVINSILSKFAQLSSAEFLFLMVHMLQLAFLRVPCIMCTHVEISILYSCFMHLCIFIGEKNLERCFEKAKFLTVKLQEDSVSCDLLNVACQGFSQK